MRGVRLRKVNLNPAPTAATLSKKIIELGYLVEVETASGSLVI